MCIIDNSDKYKLPVVGLLFRARTVNSPCLNFGKTIEYHRSPAAVDACDLPAFSL